MLEYLITAGLGFLVGAGTVYVVLLCSGVLATRGELNRIEERVIQAGHEVEELERRTWIVRRRAEEWIP